MVNGSLYLVGFVGVQYLEKERLSEKITGWMDLVEVLARLELQHLQTDYDGLQKSFHQEWDFIQRVTPNIGEAFCLVDQALEKSFLPALFQGSMVGVLTQGINLLTVDQAQLTIPKPTLSV